MQGDRVNDRPEFGGQSEHEKRVAEIEEESGGGLPSSDAELDEGAPSTSGEDLAEDRRPGFQEEPPGPDA